MRLALLLIFFANTTALMAKPIEYETGDVEIDWRSETDRLRIRTHLSASGYKNYINTCDLPHESNKVSGYVYNGRCAILFAMDGRLTDLNPTVVPRGFERLANTFHSRISSYETALEMAEIWRGWFYRQKNTEKRTFVVCAVNDTSAGNLDTHCVSFATSPTDKQDGAPLWNPQSCTVELGVYNNGKTVAFGEEMSWSVTPYVSCKHPYTNVNNLLTTDWSTLNPDLETDIRPTDDIGSVRVYHVPTTTGEITTELLFKATYK